MNKEQYWSRFAEDFEERNHYVVGSGDLAVILDEVGRQKELKTVLELGCGNGTYSRILIREAARLTATDFSDEMVAAASIRLKDYETIKVEKADCFNLPYANASFDTVFMANLLHVIPGPEKAIQESRRVLKKGGRLIILSFTSQGMTIINKITMMYRYLKTYGKPSPSAQILTVDKAAAMLEDNGFQVEESKLIGNKMKAVFLKGVL